METVIIEQIQNIMKAAPLDLINGWDIGCEKKKYQGF
jgi:hypothetical protein